MANLITTVELNENTGIDLENTPITEINTQITNAQSEMEDRTSREFSDTDSDIRTVKRALSFLASYYIRTKRYDYASAIGFLPGSLMTIEKVFLMIKQAKH